MRPVTQVRKVKCVCKLKLCTLAHAAHMALVNTEYAQDAANHRMHANPTAARQVETSHAGKRAYKVKGLTEHGAAQMTFKNKCAQGGGACVVALIARLLQIIPVIHLALEWFFTKKLRRDSGRP